MKIKNISHTGFACSLVALVGMLAGCEGWNRKHDYSVADVKPPAEDAEPTRNVSGGTANFADLVEDMMATRQEFIGQVKSLQSAYLAAGDSVKANWCRRLSWQLDEVLNYPFLSAAPAEHRVDVSPVESIQEAIASMTRPWGSTSKSPSFRSQAPWKPTKKRPETPWSCSSES